MLSIRLSTICLLALAICWPNAGGVLGDTIKLRNGYAIHGTVVEEHPQSEKYLRVEFSNRGWMLIAKKNIESVTPDNTDQFENRSDSKGDSEE